MKNVANTSLSYLSKCLLKNSNNILNDVWKTSRMHLYSNSKQTLAFEKFKYLRQNSAIFQEKNFYVEMLLDELLSECGVNTSAFIFHITEKKFILNTDINTLKRTKLLDKNVDVIAKLLSHIEPFPFDPHFNPSNRPPKNQQIVTIKKIRDSVEKQYLAWKLDVDVNVIIKVLSCYKRCLTEGRSVRSIQRNIQSINEEPKVCNENLMNKMYLYTMRPFNNETLQAFENNFLGLSWDVLSKLYPEIILRPYGSIMLLLEVLKGQNLTDKQVLNGLRFFKGSFTTLLYKLNYILVTPQFSRLRNHDDFLKLLCYSSKELKELKFEYEPDFSSLNNRRWKRSKLYPTKITINDLRFHLQKYVNVKNETIEKICKHPKLFLASFDQILDTLNYLKKKFTEEEILESIPIVLYSRKYIDACLEKIKEDEKNLQRVAFTNGHVSEETTLFMQGTKLKNKTLQLCLYYMEKPHNFSGCGIFF